MVVLGSNANPDSDQVKKMVDEPVEINAKGLAEGKKDFVDAKEDFVDVKEDFVGDKEDCNGDRELLEDEKKDFVSGQLVASSPATMDKAMLKLNLEKPKVGENARVKIKSEHLLFSIQWGGPRKLIFASRTLMCQGVTQNSHGGPGGFSMLVLNPTFVS